MSGTQERARTYDALAMADEYTAIINEARAAIADGREPDAQALEARIRAVGEATAGRRERALKQLERVLSIHRARGALAREPEPPPAPARRIGVSRAADDHREHGRAPREARDSFVLAWDTAAGIAQWEVRISERPDARRDYAVRETLNSAGERDDARVARSATACCACTSSDAAATGDSSGAQ